MEERMPQTTLEARRAQLTDRVKNILMNPADEWRVIAGESTDVTALLRDYAAPLAAIPALCRWIGNSLFGVGIVRGFASAIVSWALSLVGAWIAAAVIEKLAPTFQSRGDTTQALKLVVYASTPIWIAGVLNLVPALGVLIVLAAIYAIYLFYLGLPPVMHTPTNQVLPFMMVSAVVVILVTFIMGLFASALAGLNGATF
jgi:hypothetical protein